MNFYIDKRVDRRGDAAIRVSVSVRGVRVMTSTGEKVAPQKWDRKRQEVKRGAVNGRGVAYSTINRRLTAARAHLMACEDRWKEERRDLVFRANLNPAPTGQGGQDTGDGENGIYRINVANGDYSEEIRRKILRECALLFGRVKPWAAERDGLMDRWDEFVRERGKQNEWTKATYEKFAALKRHVADWATQRVEALSKSGRGVQDVASVLSFESFSEQGLGEFVAFMQDKLGLRNSTVGKQVSFLKWFLNWATVKGYNGETAYQGFKPKLKTAQKLVVFLDWEELMRVYHYEIPKNGTEVTLRDTATGREYRKTVCDAGGLERARDVFCFCAMTSLRYSDAQALKRSNIEDGAMTITTQKTHDTLRIELNKYAKAILKKYAGDGWTDRALPQMSNQQMNTYLKDLCELAGINQQITQTYYKGGERIEETRPKYELISTHAGRRSFICNALMMGIPPQVVMKWTGHSDYKSMKPYIDVTDKAKAKAMEKFNEK